MVFKYVVYRNGGIIIYILYHFLSDLNKDNKDLKNQTVYEKFKVLAEKNNYSQDFYNTSEGNKILNKMATNDDAESQYNLATKYFKEKEFKSAAYWFRKSADNNDVDAQYQLGNLYLQGVGVKKNMKRSYYWYKKASEQNHAKAQFNLGQFYIQGIFVKLDKEKGIYWFRKSADNGYEKAQKILQIIT